MLFIIISISNLNVIFDILKITLFFRIFLSISMILNMINKFI